MGRSEGNAVIRADGAREAALPKQALIFIAASGRHIKPEMFRRPGDREFAITFAIRILRGFGSER